MPSHPVSLSTVFSPVPSLLNGVMFPSWGALVHHVEGGRPVVQDDEAGGGVGNQHG